jgi:hypothetical protein
MSHDALFQLGMGSVGLDAPQKEELFARHASKAYAEVFCLAHRRIWPGMAKLAVAILFRAKKRDRGNSAMARMPLGAPLATLS